MENKKLIAVDIGASSGRLFLGEYDGSSLQIAQGARFQHDPITVGRDVYWDFLHIWDRVCAGMRQIHNEHGAIASIGIDSFAPDSCFFNQDGYLLSNPLSYRTVLGSDILSEVMKQSTEQELFSYTGLQSAEILLLPQLLYLKKTRREWLMEQGTLLPLSNGLNYLLTGRMSMDFTVASITMLWDAAANRFSTKLIDRYLGKDRFLAELAQNQSVLAKVQPSFAVDGYTNTQVMNSGIHDTAVATFALELSAKGQICMNCGTWVALSVVLDKPNTSDAAFAQGLTNYGLPDGRYMLGRVSLGLFYLQSCREEWLRQGMEMSYTELCRLAREGNSFTVDLDDPLFSSTEESVLARITRYFAQRQEPGPVTVGDFVRCILQSLSARCEKTIRAICEATGSAYTEIHMGGGGIQNQLLCELLQHDTGMTVHCVASEVTVLGNLLSQLIGQGEIDRQDAAVLLKEYTERG